MDPKRISSPNPVPSEEAHHFYHRCHSAFSITINLDSTGSQISPENSIGVARNSAKLVQVFFFFFFQIYFSLSLSPFLYRSRGCDSTSICSRDYRSKLYLILHLCCYLIQFLISYLS
jgi:hypothetical protein